MKSIEVDFSIALVFGKPRRHRVARVGSTNMWLERSRQGRLSQRREQRRLQPGDLTKTRKLVHQTWRAEHSNPRRSKERFTENRQVIYIYQVTKSYEKRDSLALPQTVVWGYLDAFRLWGSWVMIFLGIRLRYSRPWNLWILTNTYKNNQRWSTHKEANRTKYITLKPNTRGNSVCLCSFWLFSIFLLHFFCI